MKYFVASDIHGYYDEFVLALTKAKYDKNNPEHILIICGDIFDRGKKPIEVYDYLRSIPKERRILIRGNHEYLLRDLALRAFPMTHDYLNGTVGTLLQIACHLAKEDQYFDEAVKNPKLKEILEWIDSDEWIDFYEVDKYIFVHAFIPLYKNNKLVSYYSADPYYDLSYIDKWRTIKSREIIEGSTWGCPWKNYLAHLFDEEAKKGKILVCGHWHSYDFFEVLGGLRLDPKHVAKGTDGYIFDIFRGKNIIALDGATYHSRQVNVLIINEDMEPYVIKDNKEAKLEIFKDAL